MDHLTFAQSVEVATQQASNQPDLFWTIIASAFGGAVITSGVTIWAKYRDSKTEHQKWLRQERLAAFVELLDHIEHLKDVTLAWLKEPENRSIKDKDSVADSKILLLSSPEVRELYSAVHNVGSDFWKLIQNDPVTAKATVSQFKVDLAKARAELAKQMREEMGDRNIQLH